MNNKTSMVVVIGTLCLILIICVGIFGQEFSWWVFPFVALFGTLFVGVLTVCFSILREDTYRDLMKTKYWNQPWMWQAKWRSNVIPSDSRRDFWGALILAITLSVFALLDVAVMLDELPRGNLWTLLWVIPFLMELYVVKYVFVAWRARRYGDLVSLVVETRPAWIGSAFSAQLIIPAGIQTGHFTVTLEHTDIVRSEESDGASFTRVIDRKIAGHVETTVNEAGQCTASITVDIQSNSPETSWSYDDPMGWWDVVIAMRVDGTDIPLRYEVPIADPVRYQTAS